MNMRVSRTFGFGTSPAARVASTEGQAGGAPVGGGGIPGMGRGGRGGGRMGGGGFGGDSRKPYNLNVSVNFSNILNKVNLGTPVGSLSSSRFGQSTSTVGGFFGGFGGGGFGGGSAANRRVELQMRFSW
jgi:hypothetical protein